MPSTHCFDLVNERKFSELKQHDCQHYLLKLHLMYLAMTTMDNTKALNELKPILSRYHRNIDVILPYVQLDFNALSQQILQMDFSQARNKSELQLQKEFENGTPSQRVLMIFEELYHFCKGSKVKLYFGNTKFFLCRNQSYQDEIRLIVIILFYIQSLPLQPNEIMDVVLSHCKNRLEFTANIFRNVPLSIIPPLTTQLVEYTEKQINIMQKARLSNHSKRIESTGKQIEIMKRIFRNLASFSPLIARQIQNVIASKQICPEIYVELSLSLQENSPKLFIQQFCANLTNINERQYLLPYLRSINSNHQMVRKLNSFLLKSITEYQRLKSALIGEKPINSKSEVDCDMDVDMKEDITPEYNAIIHTMEQFITIYLTFVGLVPNIEMDVNAIAGLLSLIEEHCPYQLLSPLLMFIVLCPRFLKMKAFDRVCEVYYAHPILDIDYFMIIHYIIQDTYQPILDSLRQYTKLGSNISANMFHHFKELKQTFLQSNVHNYSEMFFKCTKSKLLNYTVVEQYLKDMKVIHSHAELDCSQLYLHKLERFLTTAQFILHRDLFSSKVMKMDEWLFDVMAAACWPTQTIQNGFPKTCFTLFKLMDRCAMLTSRMHLESAMSFKGKINKVGVETFYNYIERELSTHKGRKSIHCYANPLQITLCVYFVLLSNHRFFKSYNSTVQSHSGNSGGSNSDVFMSDGSDIVMSGNGDTLLPTNAFRKASQFYNISRIAPFPESILYALPVTGSIQYLRLQIQNDSKYKESIDKSIEKCIYLIRHHYPHLLYWLDLNSLLVSPKFEFLQYGLNLDLMRNELYFNQSHIVNNIKTIHDTFIKDFVNNSEGWMENVSFTVPQSFFALVNDKDINPSNDIQLLPAMLSFDDLSMILKAMAASFMCNDLAHHKWQYIFCYWWHKYAMNQPLNFVCLSLQLFVTDSTNVSDIRLVLKDPNILLDIDTDRYPNIWSNVWFLNIYIRIIHVFLTANQEYLLSLYPNIYSTLANETRNNGKKADKTSKQLRSLMILNEINILETIMRNVSECNPSNETMSIVIELLLWRHCQSLSQGNCYKSSITRSDNSENMGLKMSFDNKNFKLFQNFVTSYHEKYGFDIISLLLYRTISHSYIPLLINKLVIQHNNHWNILHAYQSIVMQHFESFSNKLLLSPDCEQTCMQYFGDLKEVNQAWLFAVIFVVEAMLLTDDKMWINCFKFIMEELRDIVQQLTNVSNGYYIKSDKVREALVSVLDGLWFKVKDSKYMMDGFMLKQFSLSVSNPVSDLNGASWPYIDTDTEI